MKVAIIGGGLAGISAAYTLLASRNVTEVHLFESSGGFGGRARTDSTSIPGFAFDMGAQYIQDPDINPLVQIAKDLKFTAVAEDASYMLRVDTDDGWIDEPTTTPDVQAVVDAIQASYNKAETQPNAIVAPKPSFDTQVEMFGHATSTYGPFTESAETWQYIAADRAREADGDHGNNLFVLQGIGTLVATHGQQLAKLYPTRFTAHFNATVKAVNYGDSSATLTWGSNSLQVDACIVTVPASVLGSGAIAFTPALPASYTGALTALRLGSYKKLALKLRTDPESIVPGTNYYLIETQPEGVWQYYRLPYAPTVLVAHAAGDFAAALDGMADSDVFTLFKTSIQTACDDVFFTTGKAITNWGKTPGVNGAYSYTAFIGGGPTDPTTLKARTTLGTPLKTLHFAGEATNLKYYGTLQAACFEGERAAGDVLATA
jgi:monoamine oxidase